MTIFKHCRAAALTATVIVTLSAIAADTTVSDTTDVNTLGEVVVTGTHQTLPSSLLPYTVTVVAGRQLEAAGNTQVLSVLSGMVPGVFVSQRSVFGFGVSNGGSGHIKMRGVGGDRASGVLMMVDGRPQFAGIYSHHIADFYDKEYVDRVEVLRGPGSVLYGSNAMAGVINIITRKPQNDGVQTVITSQYGSYNTWLSSATNTVKYGRFSSLASISYNRTDGTVDNFDFKQADGYIKASYDFSRRWSGAIDYTLMNFKGSDPIYPTLSDPTSTDIYKQSVTRGEVAATITNTYTATSGVGRIYYHYGNHFVDDPRHFHSKDSRLGIMLYQNFAPWRGATASLGFDFDTYAGEIPVSGGKTHDQNPMATLERKTITEYSPYLTIAQSLAGNRLNLNAGVRVAASDMFDTHLVPQFGFAVNPSHGFTIKGNLAMGYRNPSFRELYLYKPANPDLKPEQMMNYELSLAKNFSRYFAGELTAYFSQGSDMIQTVDGKNLNTGSFINKGIEIAARSHLLDNLWLTASYSYLHTSLSNLVGAPKNQYYIGVQWRPWQVLDIAADLRGIGSLYVADNIKHQNYALLNLKISWDVCRYLAIFTRLENITDARYVINRGYDMPGFTAMGGFKVKF